jgi:hypothetical protein
VISLLLGLLSGGMVLYQIIVIWRMWRMPHYQSTLEDWLWYIVLPLLADILFIVAAILLAKNPVLALYLVGSAMLLLLIVGIRNAWDNVTFLALMRGHSHAEDQAEEKKRDDPSVKHHT